MTIEQTLASMDATLKAILAALLSGAQMAAATEGAAAETEKKGRKTAAEKKAEEAAAAAEKAAAEKKQPAETAAAVTTQQANVDSAPSATAQQATASASATGTPTWDEVVAGLQKLAKDPAHGAIAVKEIINQFGAASGATNVPGLQALGKNAEILAAVNAKLVPATGDEALFG